MPFENEDIDIVSHDLGATPHDFFLWYRNGKRPSEASGYREFVESLMEVK